MGIAITEDCIKNASAQFWGQMLSMEVEPVEGCQAARPRCIASEHVVGSCDLSGVWQGRIEVRLSRGLVLQATSTMLMQPIESVRAADELDATKEIANMIAGTIKSALPRPIKMTVPSAELHDAEFCDLPRTENSVCVFFAHAAGELMVRVWQEEQA